MPYDNIGPLHFLFLFAIAISLLIVVLSNQKMSIATQKRFMSDYNSFIHRCNDSINNVNFIIDRLSKRYFVSVQDKENADLLINNYNELYNAIFNYNENISKYLRTRNSKRYQKLKREAERTVEQIEQICTRLSELIQHTVSEEEWEYAQRIRKAEREYRNYKSQHASDRNTYTYSTPEKENLKTKEDGFFSDCLTKAEVEKRYRTLAKKYHPDMPTGSKEKFQKLLEQYERKKLKYE